ncbi:glycosyltransferase family 4 protein [Polluticaenibacter yanchengensis]|uniref:MraY family glycosyltransferase n=1 Tax=Polluticaenibacter yanchengensis TaxID=3014562 RepID=A0ABT4UP12_9BACT|nr:MraY family glycosyltransferase [Chitinophagaceae bacterium LY-5]
MMEITLGLLIAFIVTYYSIPIIIKVSYEKKLFDLPNERKLHSNSISTLGGIGIFAGIVCSFLLSVGFADNSYGFQYLMAACIVTFFIGLKDDISNLSPYKKFLGHILAALILVIPHCAYLNNYGGVLGIYEVPPLIAYIISIVLIVLIINAFNLIDGMDGLAASVSIIACIGFFIFFFLNQKTELAAISAIITGALLAFLIFNRHPAKIFMGDTGALLLGLLFAYLAFAFINIHLKEGAVLAYKFQSPHAMAFILLFLPLFDTFRVFAIRILKGGSPFEADRNHLHHIILRLGFGTQKTVFFMISGAILFTGAGILLDKFGNNIALFTTIGIACSTMAVLVRKSGQINKQKSISGKESKKQNGFIRILNESRRIVNK